MRTAASQSLVRIRDLRFRYPGSDSDVLRIPFLDISGRGLIALTGPSGVGKSTLIELLAGTLREPYDGSLLVLGAEWRDLGRDADRQRHLRRIGLIPQDYGLLTTRTPRQMLQQDLADAGIDPRAREERITSALADMELTHFADRTIGSLSGGQRQRVAIARMLARDVELVIADEPTANLDHELTWQTIAILRRLAQHVPVLVITHEPEVAEACDRTIVLQSAGALDATPLGQTGSSGDRSRMRMVAAIVAILALGAGAITWFATRHEHQPAAVAAHTPTAHAAPGVKAKPTSPVAAKITSASRPSSRIAPPAPNATAIKFFTPFDTVTGKPVVRVVSTQAGSCWEGSVAVNDPNAFRCSTTGNEILDPCFGSASVDTGALICVDAPWDSGTELRLTQPVKSNAIGNAADPTWAFELANGDRCVAITGTSNVVAGIPMNYGCQSGAQAGGLNRAGRLWTIEYLARRASAITSVPVTTAWG